MTETKIELSGSCRFTLTTYENSDRKDMSLDYTEHSTDHWNSDTETSIDIDTNKAREIVAFMHKSFPEIATQKPVAWRLSNEVFDYQITSYDEEQANTYIKNGWHLIDVLYTPLPAQRKPLTPEWIWMWLRNWCDRHPSLRQETYNSLYKMVSDARAIETAHGITGEKK